MRCVASRCTPGTGDAAADDASRPGDAGRDAAMVLVDAAMSIDAARSDAGNDAAMSDAGHDGGSDGGRDAGRDGGHDGGRDGGTDANRDAAHVPSTVPLLFSEYVEGSGNNKALEIVNLGTASYDLTLCTLELYTNGGSGTPFAMYDLPGSLAASGVYTLCNATATGFSASTCTDSLDASVMAFNGNDAILLRCEGMVVDVIGQIGNDPGGAGWGTTVTTTNETLRRVCSVTAGDTDGSDAFDPATEWTSAGMDVFDGLGVYGCP
jgi:hypothetical protein